jgi:hypothetical protein
MHVYENTSPMCSELVGGDEHKILSNSSIFALLRRRVKLAFHVCMFETNDHYAKPTELQSIENKSKMRNRFHPACAVLSTGTPKAFQKWNGSPTLSVLHRGSECSFVL